MSNSHLGLIVGLVLGLAGAFGGIGAFLIVLVLGVIGLGVGRWLDGALDLDGLTGRGRSGGGAGGGAGGGSSTPGAGPRVRL